MAGNRVDDAQFRKAIREVPGRLYSEWRREFGGLLGDFDARMQLKRLRGRPGVFVRTGGLRNSFNHVVRGGSLGNLVGRYYTNKIYAPVQERGARISPRRARYLTIPLEAAKTQAGVARGRARDFSDTFIIRSKGGNLFIMQRRPGQKAVPLFLLRKQVRIPPRLGLVAEWRAFRPKVVQGLRQATRRALKGSR